MVNSSIIDNFVAPKCFEEIQILFEDEFLLVINKPSGLLSLSGKNPLNKDSVHYRLAQQYPEIRLVHRLDLGTSGILLLAKDKVTNAKLTKQFQTQTVVKRYVSVLAGKLLTNQGLIDLPIAKDATLFPRLKICHQEGKPSQTQYSVLERYANPSRTKVLFTPLTGRTHQLRLHSQAIGHAILGCDLYGTAATQAMASRLLLHALDIRFEHPHLHQPITLTSPCPF
ncbi:pseudouridine synthase [uncultured Paraglaciecola sp.]|uniref:RluA family pseudouridine synthase n=1 Tax=uncultured Paraglaciecola sp. TaxID=1765024 RepID=UPI00262B29FE|nr:pseudouridine synthase [uncultured Paraglaciecola sp.]